jgi:hypothetical protein
MEDILFVFKHLMYEYGHFNRKVIGPDKELRRFYTVKPCEFYIGIGNG